MKTLNVQRRSRFGLPLGLAFGLGLGACAGAKSDAASPQPATAGAETSAMGVDNRPVLLPVPADPSVAFNLWFRVGSQDDPVGKEGLASLTADLMTEGATEANSYEQILAKLYPLASSYGANVDREMTTFRGRTHRDNLETYVGLYSDAILHPKFDAADFERVKSARLNYLEKTLRYASDEELGKAALYQFVFEGTRYAHPSIGTVSGLKSITLDDVKAFYAANYNQGSLVVGLGGGYSEDLVGRMAGVVDQLPKGEAPQSEAPVPASFEGRHLVMVDKPNADSSISFGFPIDVHRGDDDFYALWLANSWLGEHRNSVSHLYQVIRSTRGLNYGDYSYIEAFTNGGRRSMPPSNVARRQQIFEVWIRTLPNDQSLFALRAALLELDKLVKNGLTAEQFELTRSFLKKYVLHFAENTSGRLGYAMDDRFYGISEPGHLAQFRAALDAMTLEDVNGAIRRHLQTENLKIAIVSGETASLKQAIVNDTPTPITYKAEKSDEVLAEDKIISSLKLGIPAENIRIIPVDSMFQ